MTPVNQQIIDGKRGDCMRCTCASILDIPYDAVPNFTDLPEWSWWQIYLGFFYVFGWVYTGRGAPEYLTDSKNSINGLFVASVPSRNYPKAGHSVIIDHTGFVVFDPNPKKQWQCQNPLESGELLNYWCFRPRDDEEWKTWGDCWSFKDEVQ